MKFPSTTAALRAAAASATRTGVIHTHHIHQVLEALPAGARLPMHLIVKRTGLPPHVVHPIVEALVSEARLQPVRVTTPGNVSRRFYARPEYSTPIRAHFPRTSERGFHGDPSADSTRIRARIPRVSEQ